MSTVHQIEHEGKVIAVIVPGDFDEPGIRFFTSGDLSQQLAQMRHPKGKIIESHVHNPVARDVRSTQETLFIKRGRLRVDLYSNRRKYLESRVLKAGDVILLVSGGHGFEVLEEVSMIEVKQGPYVGDGDKTRFPGARPDEIRIRKGRS